MPLINFEALIGDYGTSVSLGGMMQGHMSVHV